jgi:hypothetical protein
MRKHNECEIIGARAKSRDTEELIREREREREREGKRGR